MLERQARDTIELLLHPPIAFAQLHPQGRLRWQTGAHHLAVNRITMLKFAKPGNSKEIEPLMFSITLTLRGLEADSARCCSLCSECASEGTDFVGCLSRGVSPASIGRARSHPTAPHAEVDLHAGWKLAHHQGPEADILHAHDLLSPPSLALSF
jgi:hypothetical protein